MVEESLWKQFEEVACLAPSALAIVYVFYSLLRYVASWIERREVQSERANLSILFDKYVPILLDNIRSGKFKQITPVHEVSMIQTLCYLLEALLTPEHTPPDTAKDVYELYFVFAAIWAFGGFVFQDQVRALQIMSVYPFITCMLQFASKKVMQFCKKRPCNVFM